MSPDVRLLLRRYACALGWGHASAAELAEECFHLGFAEGRAHLRWLRGRLDALGKRPS